MRWTVAPQMTPLRGYDVVFDQHTYEGKGLGRDGVSFRIPGVRVSSELSCQWQL